MGMPGSETALEELMCRILGHLLQEEIVIKIADNLYCGGNTLYEQLENWKKVLQALYQCNLRLSAILLLPQFFDGSGGLEPYRPAHIASQP